MKKWFSHSYMVLLILSCVIIVPTTLLLDACKHDTPEDPIVETTSTVTTTTTTAATTTTTTTVDTTTTTTAAVTTPSVTAGTTTASGVPSSTTFPDASARVSFPDTLFIGDSRTVGLRDYGKTADATFFCAVGLSSNNVTTKAVEVAGYGEILLSSLLEQKPFKTVYIMLGINEIGGTLSSIVQKYQKIIELVHSKQPSALVVVQSTLHVAKARHDQEIAKKGHFNNDRINELNGMLAALANGTTVQYLDMNPMFDENGCLMADAAAGDGIHIKAKYYLLWRSYLDTHRVS